MFFDALHLSLEGGLIVNVSCIVFWFYLYAALEKSAVIYYKFVMRIIALETIKLPVFVFTFLGLM